MGKQKPKTKKTSQSSLKLILLFILFLSSLLLFLVVFLSDKIFPGIFVGGEDLGGLTQPQAELKLDQLISQRTSKVLKYSYKNQAYQIDLSPQSKTSSIQSLSNQAFEFGHFRFYSSKVNLPLFTQLNASITDQISKIAQGVDEPPTDSAFKLDGGEIAVTASKDGLVLDSDSLEENILSFLNTASPPFVVLPTKKASPKLSYSQALIIKKELDNIKLSPLILKFKDQSFKLDLPTILSLISPDSKLSLDQKRLSDYLTANISSQINRDVKEPIFSYDGKKVTDFQPPQEGYSLNLEESIKAVNSALSSQNFDPISLPVDITPPKNKLVNDLGIKELLGEGVSHFAHSIPNRIYNIGLAASRINGTLIPPGGIFSYNGTVGEISAATGFKQGYVIKSNRTVLDDGGGVCQDSTTLFRAALKAGLPIVERVAHAYRVGYYEQDSPPGFDATVFAPSVDFKFKNDTTSHILIQAYTTDDESLIIDLYGTSDGRSATISTPVVTNQTQPPPDVNQDDPTLPKGETKQVDFQAWGANVSFSRQVTRDGAVLINETFRSNYRPWAAVYLVGTQ